MEFMDMRRPWVGLGDRSPWALRNGQLGWVGRQRSCEEVLMQEGLGKARGNSRRKIIIALSPASGQGPWADPCIQLMQQSFPENILCLKHHSRD